MYIFTTYPLFYFRTQCKFYNMTAENYHLKWDSHLSYLNSSVATLYKYVKILKLFAYVSTF